MAVSYKKLWHLLIDKDMKKKDLQEAANLTSHAMRKLSHDEAITTDTLAKICRCLDCKVDDIMEVIEIDDDQELNSNDINYTYLSKENTEPLHGIVAAYLFCQFLQCYYGKQIP